MPVTSTKKKQADRGTRGVAPEQPKRVGHRFKKGEPRPAKAGRQPGKPNKVPTLLKEAIMIAAELEGSDGKGKGKLVGFLRKVAKEDIRSFAHLLGRVLPLQIYTKGETTVQVTYRSWSDVQEALAGRGITPTVIEHTRLPVIEHREIEAVDDGD
jgi:hypothetical protein